MHPNRDSIGHKKSYNSTIEAQYQRDIYLQQSSPQWGKQKYPTLNVKCFFPLILIFKELKKLVPCKEMKNRHYWNVLNQNSQLNYFSNSIKYHIFCVLMVFKATKYSGELFSIFICNNLFDMIRATDTSNKSNKEVYKSCKNVPKE